MANNGDQLTDAAEQWIARARSPHTARTYRKALRKWGDIFDSPPGGHTTEADLIKFSDSLAGLAPATQATYQRSVKALLRWGHDEGLWQCPRSVRQFKTRNIPTSAAARYLSPEHARAIIAAAVYDRDRLMLQCLFSLGLRNAELRSLRWEDLHYEHLSVHGKGDKVRSLRVPDALLKELRLYQSATTSKGLIFRSFRSGSKLAGADLWRAVKAAVAIAREKDPTIPEKVSPHWFRHALATAALQGGASFKQVQTALGHASGSTTINTYIHAVDDVAIADFV